MSASLPLKIHLISLDVPYPPDYGGMIDVFFTLKHLSMQGVEVYLHCFEYGRAQQPELEKWCKQVWYYPRQSGFKGLSLKHPYMMYSRRHPDLLARLQAVEAPILFEGIHTTYLLRHPSLANRKKIIRNQNVEQEYFSLLGKKEATPWRKLYFKVETYLLRRLEQHLQAAHAFLTVSQHDYDFFKKLYPHHVHEYIPSFQPYDEVTSEPGRSDFIIYHGNLGHVENADALRWLAAHVFPLIRNRVVVAGKNPSYRLQKTLSAFPHITLMSNPSQEDMQRLIQQAQIQLLPTFQASGLKLKLLNALFRGRHVLVNKAMLHGTDLHDVCHVAETGNEMVARIEALMQVPFSLEEKQQRSALLLQHYNNVRNAQRIKALL